MNDNHRHLLLLWLYLLFPPQFKETHIFKDTHTPPLKSGGFCGQELEKIEVRETHFTLTSTLFTS